METQKIRGKLCSLEFQISLWKESCEVHNFVTMHFTYSRKWCQKFFTSFFLISFVSQGNDKLQGKAFYFEIKFHVKFLAQILSCLRNVQLMEKRPIRAKNSKTENKFQFTLKVFVFEDCGPKGFTFFFLISSLRRRKTISILIQKKRKCINRWRNVFRILNCLNGFSGGMHRNVI